MSFNVAIDGPAGAGKSTIAKKIAKQMGYIYIDTGAMYRAMALYFIQNGINAEERDKISTKCKEADITIQYQEGEQIVLLNGKNVNGLIRTEEVGKMASVSSVNKDVREKLVDLQQKLAATANVIMDGRDIGTCVLPNADVKIYLTASSYIRAKRRYEELMSKGERVEFDMIEKERLEKEQIMHG